ncbi:TPA: AraC family transcriptional regulator, partial [Elizabethkingia anophelis]
VIITHKNKNFREYIGALRINYIVELLETDPQYRKLKIPLLAEKSGFSSINTFREVFKKEKSLPPLVFIKMLEKL